MYDYSYVLGLLRASADDLQRHALSSEKTRIARMTTDRTLRNRALAITHRLQGMAEPEASVCRRGRPPPLSRLRPPGRAPVRAHGVEGTPALDSRKERL